MARKHASLSPSASARWIACPPSARLAANYENKSSSYAEEGTSAHALCAYKLEHALGRRAREPPAARTYALGALDAYGCIYAIDFIRLAIYQPRRENVSIDEFPKAELVAWGKDILAPRAKQAYAGEGEFQAGDHCRFCPAKADCRKRAEYNLELAKYDFAMPDTLGEDEIAALLPRIDEFIAWANDIKAFALQKALDGTHFDGYKIVAGRSVRKYTDEAAVAKAVQDAGFDPFERRLLGITAMGKLLGKKRMEDLLGGLMIKPPGKPTLVPETDKRRALDPAVEDFHALP